MRRARDARKLSRRLRHGRLGGLSIQFTAPPRKPVDDVPQLIAPWRWPRLLVPGPECDSRCWVKRSNLRSVVDSPNPKSEKSERHLSIVPIEEPKPELCGAWSVLVVDDSPADAYLVRRFLESAAPNATVEVVSTYDEGLQALLSTRFDVALVDHRLGARTGLQMIEVARERGIQIPLIVLTCDISVEGEALQRGASDFIDKNEMTSRSLERMIRFNLHRARAFDEKTRQAQVYEAAVTGAADGIWDWDFATGSIHLSSRFREQTQMPDFEENTSFSRWLAFVHVEDREGIRRAVRSHLSGQTPAVSREYRAVLPDGGHRWMHLRGQATRGRGGRLVRLAGVQTDITARKLREEEVRRNAEHDPVTGLANRKLVEDRIYAGLHRSTVDRSYAFSVVVLEIDSFFEVNEQFGWSAGDQVLREVGRRIGQSIHAVDCIARLEGAAFAVVLQGCGSPEAARGIAADLASAAERPIDVASGAVLVRVTTGVEVVTTVGADPGEILRGIDRDIYGHKARRRWTESTAEGTVEVDPEAEAGLRSALREQEVAVRYEPIFDAGTRSVVGFEALALWTDEKLGLVPPERLVPVALHSGLNVELERQMLLQACSWAAAASGDPFVTVKVSASHAASLRFVLHVEEALVAAMLPANRLRLEMTEHQRWTASDAALESLRTLADMGVCIDIGQFGSGHGSVELLRRFPISSVKLPRALVQALAEDSRARRFLQHVVQLAHTAEATVTVEGVETEAEYEVLCSMRVENMQGALFGSHGQLGRAPTHAPLEDVG